MREIKFRAWDKKGQMYHGEDVSFIRGRFVKSSYTACWWSDEAQLLYGQQYTGLKDVNGVEIYEGDIVVIRYSEHGYHYCEQIIFENGAFLASDEDWLCNVYEYCEVCGNIYENPELLQNDGAFE
ncbi:YopX family protein [Enterococcus sp. LJL120]